jgi:hypothetical protein
MEATMAQAGPKNRHDLEQKIVALAWKDDDFRKAFLADPKGQFEARLGTALPPGLKIAAHQEDENHLHFVIPVKPAVANLGELSDADLEKVAGGIDVITTAFVVTSAATVAAGAAASVNAMILQATDFKAGWKG